MSGLRFLKLFALVVLLILLVPPVALIFFLLVTEYRPAPVETIPIPAGGAAVPDTFRTISFLTWNIGYAGLGSSMDFFYDGGHMVNPPRSVSSADLMGIRSLLSHESSTDIIFLQEVDRHSRRSYKDDQFDSLSVALANDVALFAVNYDCRYIPVPLRDPMGRVLSGIATFSRFRPSSAARYGYNALFPIPKRLVFLRRCFMVLRYSLRDGGELVVVNLHNSTFDAGGSLRLKELQQLGEFLEGEYRKGHYVICGGDWNMNPRGFHPERITSGDKAKVILPPVPEDFLPGWEFIFDPTLPTNRDVDEAYLKGRNGTTIIDFFVISPNVERISIHTLDLKFSWSDHNPVKASFMLLPPR